MENRDNGGKIIANGSSGGLIYQLENGGTIKDCYNAGQVVSTTMGAGGIIYMSNQGKLTFENCYNTASIIGKSIFDTTKLTKY